MKPVHQVLFAAGLLLLGTVTWLLLTRPEPPADWLRVEAPAKVVSGETITIRVTLTDPEISLQLATSLHGWTSRNRRLRAISQAAPRRLDPAVRTFDFKLQVPELPDLAEVRAVIYLSPTGHWRDHIRVAATDPIPVKPAAHRTSLPELRPVAVYEPVPAPVTPRLESFALRHLIVALWLVVALGLGLRVVAGRQGRPATTGNPARQPHATLVGACLLIVLAELLHAEQRVGDAARQLALEYGLYDVRLLPQQLALLFMVVGVVALAGFILLRARHRRIVLGLLLHAAIAATAILSLHEADAVLYATCLGLPIEQLAKLAAGSLALSGLQAAVGRSAP